jgi:hypothetical protein
MRTRLGLEALADRLTPSVTTTPDTPPAGQLCMGPQLVDPTGQQPSYYNVRPYQPYPSYVPPVYKDIYLPPMPRLV